MRISHASKATSNEGNTEIAAMEQMVAKGQSSKGANPVGEPSPLPEIRCLGLPDDRRTRGVRSSPLLTRMLSLPRPVLARRENDMEHSCRDVQPATVMPRVASALKMRACTPVELSQHAVEMQRIGPPAARVPPRSFAQR